MGTFNLRSQDSLGETQAGDPAEDARQVLALLKRNFPHIRVVAEYSSTDGWLQFFIDGGYYDPKFRAFVAALGAKAPRR